MQDNKTVTPPNPKDPTHYVSNKEFYAAMKEYIAACRLAESEGRTRPNPSNYICDCLMRIARKYANRPNFVRYPFRDEMIGDAILNCIKYCHKFNPDKSTNPFSYFTQACHNSFLQRIKVETDEMSIKAKYINESVASDFLDTQFGEDDGEFKNNFIEFLKENSIYEDKILKRKTEALEKKKEAAAELAKKSEDIFDKFKSEEDKL